MGKDMTFWVFIGMFQGIIDKTMAFRKIEDAKKAFRKYTEFDWDEICSDKDAIEHLEHTKFSGSTIEELQIEP